MLIVPDAHAAFRWYESVLGATVLWDLGSVMGISVGTSPFFLHEGDPGGIGHPDTSPSQAIQHARVRIELFTDHPAKIVDHALLQGATLVAPVVNESRPWGSHAQGSFLDPFGHLWSVGDHSPLSAHHTDI